MCVCILPICNNVVGIALGIKMILNHHYATTISY